MGEEFHQRIEIYIHISKGSNGILELKNTFTEIKNSLEKLNSRRKNWWSGLGQYKISTIEIKLKCGKMHEINI